MTVRAGNDGKVCVRPSGVNGWTTRAMRDAERERDPVRCLCGQDYCRDRELLDARPNDTA